MPFVDLAAQQSSLSEEIGETIGRALARTDWILGEEVRAFEQEFASYCETSHAVGTDSGMSALELALHAYGIGPGDEVITAAHTFIATALAISHSGAKPVLVDVDEERYTIDPAAVERAVTIRTKAIMPVHLYGQPADLDAILEIADAYRLIVIEDACQAHGARYRRRRVGSVGHAAAFSFYPAKNLGAYGDGGIMVTNDERIAESVAILRDYGRREKYNHVVKGYNRRLDTLQAAILRVKLRHLDEWNEARRSHAKLYDRLLTGTPVITPRAAEDVEHVWHLYVVRVRERAALRALLDAHGITTGIHYPAPVHLQPAYKDLGYARGAFPVAECLADEVVSLPMYPELTPTVVERVASSLLAFENRVSPAAVGASLGDERAVEAPQVLEPLLERVAGAAKQ